MTILLDDPTTHSVPDDDRRLSLAELLALGGCHRLPVNVHENDAVAANNSGSDKRNSTAVSANGSEPIQGVSPNLPRGCHQTSDHRSEEVSSLFASLERATQAKYRNKAKTKILRSALTLPPKPSESSYYAHKVRSNKKAISLEHRILQFERQMAERLAKKKTNPRMRYAPHDSAYERLWTYGSALAYRALNDRHKAGESIPDTAALEAAVALHLERRAKKLLRPSDPTPAKGYVRFATVDAEQLDYLSRTLAGAVLRDWRQTWIERKQKAGRKGGRTSKPPASIWADAEKLAELAEHMDTETNAQLCRRFENISPSTLHRGLRALGGRAPT